MLNNSQKNAGKNTWTPEVYASIKFWFSLQKYTLWQIKPTLPLKQFYWREAIIPGYKSIKH